MCLRLQQEQWPRAHAAAAAADAADAALAETLKSQQAWRLPAAAADTVEEQQWQMGLLSLVLSEPGTAAVAALLAQSHMSEAVLAQQPLLIVAAEGCWARQWGPLWAPQLWWHRPAGSPMLLAGAQLRKLTAPAAETYWQERTEPEETKVRQW